MAEKNEKKVTVAEPAALYPPELVEALAALLAIEDDPCWMEQREFNEAVQELAQTPLARNFDLRKIVEEIKKVKANPNYESELLSDPLVKANERLSTATKNLLLCRKR